MTPLPPYAPTLSDAGQSWLPGRALDRNSAITAMTLADHAGEPDLNEQHRLWPFIEGWAAELGLTGPDAINRASQPAAPASSTTGKVSGPTPRRDNDRPVASAPRPESLDQPARLGTPRSRCRPVTTAPRPPSRSGQDPHSGRLAYSVDEAARLTGLSRDLLYDEMRRGDLAYVKVGRRRLITRQHLQQFLGIAS